MRCDAMQCPLLYSVSRARLLRGYVAVMMRTDRQPGIISSGVSRTEAVCVLWGLTNSLDEGHKIITSYHLAPVTQSAAMHLDRTGG